MFFFLKIYINKIKIKDKNLLPRTTPLRAVCVVWDPRCVDSGFFNAVAAKACSAARS